MLRWNLGRMVCGTIMFALVATLGLGSARLYHASVLTASINEGISSEITLDNALELTRRVAARFRDIGERGPLGEAGPWLIHSDADALLTGGDCGRAAGALGAVFASRKRPFRIIQVNVGAAGAGHIMFETPDEAGRWVLLDPLAGRGFARPSDGRLLGLEEIRALPVDQRQWLHEQYRGGAGSLFAPYRRTNWARLGPLDSAVRWIAGESWTAETSLRASLITRDYWLTEGAAIVKLLIALAGVMMRLSA